MAVFYGCVPRAEQDRTGYPQGLFQNLGFFEKVLWGMQWGQPWHTPVWDWGCSAHCTTIPTTSLFFHKISPGWGLDEMKHWDEIQVCRNSCKMSEPMTREGYMEKCLKNSYNPVKSFKAYHPEGGKPEK